MSDRFTNIISLLQQPGAVHLHRHLAQIHSLFIRSQPDLLPLLLDHVLLTLSPSPAAAMDALEMFESIPQPESDLCGRIVSAFSKLSLHREVLAAFFSAHRKGTPLPFPSISLALKACASIPDSEQGRQVHCHLLLRGLGSNVFIQAALIDFYCKAGDLSSAQRAFDDIAAKDPVPVNCLISGYSKAGNVLQARRLFDEMTKRTSASWNSMISCYSRSGDFPEALRLFERMQQENARPNGITAVTLLSICAKLGDLKTGEKVKCLIADTGLQKDLILQTALLEMYVKCGDVDKARQVFDEMAHRDVVAWSAMISGYAQNGKSEEALDLFERMRTKNCKPNEVTLVGILSASAQLGSAEIGERIGSYIEGQGLATGVHVCSALVDMYSKCGNIHGARRVFDKMKERDVVTWNSMIAGLALNGLAEDSFRLYRRMKVENFKPNDITFVGLLTACTHAGRVEQGLATFHSMKLKHGIAPKVEHCACIVDLFCRSGRLEDAYKFICEMEVEPNVVIWGTLLSSCRIHSNVELAKICMKKLLVLEPENSSNYVLLSNVYADAGRWNDVKEIRNLMKRKNVQKLSAYSWIELDGEVHKFLVEDSYHPSRDEIYRVVDSLSFQLTRVGHDHDLEYANQIMV
ncbi:pentatricopeptide repeat-containing protein At1g08070, chloroplastic-like [Curcuma longa]|uniref:pentatricopeptide repeat-containing protein At1g08070, chloroplastic-like n=1 Tax=Curcuma longa TaxID=136217 RepID=UPI003D9E4D14